MFGIPVAPYKGYRDKYDSWEFKLKGRKVEFK